MIGLALVSLLAILSVLNTMRSIPDGVTVSRLVISNVLKDTLLTLLIVNALLIVFWSVQNSTNSIKTNVNVAPLVKENAWGTNV